MSRNQELLTSFAHFCKAHPELRFWQALRQWSGWGYVLVGMDRHGVTVDTYSWQTNQEPPTETTHARRNGGAR